MKKSIIDERVNKIELEIIKIIYEILKIFLGISAIYQMVILRLPASSYMVETIALIVAEIIETIAYAKSGILNNGDRSIVYKKTFKKSGISAVILAILYPFLFGINNYKDFFIMIFIYFVLHISFNIIINRYNCYKLDVMNNDFDD